MTDHDVRNMLRTRLERAGLTVNEDASRTEWQVSRGGDPFEATGAFDLDRLLEQISSVPTDDQGPFVGAVVRGIAEVLYEPDNSDAAQWEFDRAAGAILPTLERPGFEIGASAVSGEDIRREPFEADLFITYRILLDAGKRVLTTGQFEGWKASADRVSSAARSLLFHRSRDADPTPLSEDGPVEQFAMDDGHDAARLTVIEDLMFGEFDSSSRLAIPTADSLFFVRNGDEESVRTLRSACNQQYEASDHPLTRRLFQFRRSKPKPVDA